MNIKAHRECHCAIFGGEDIHKICPYLTLNNSELKTYLLLPYNFDNP